MSENKPAITLLMCNYNNAHYLRKGIESVLAQTFENFELLILDDCSTDESVEIIKEYVPKDERISFYQQKQNGGYGQAIYDAINLAKADYVGIIDPDDALVPEALEVMLSRLQEKPNLAGLYSQHWICDKDLNPVEVCKTSTKIPNGITYLEYGKSAMTHFFVFNRLKFIENGNIDRTMRNALDQDWYYKVEEVGEVDFVEQPLYYYRISPTGISQGFKKSYITYRDHHIIKERALDRRKIYGQKRKEILGKSRSEVMYKKFNYLLNEKNPAFLIPLAECFFRSPVSILQAIIYKLKN